MPEHGCLVGYIPITNGDRIRAMTDEELADEILSWFNWLNAVEWDDNRILDWLKQEAVDNGACFADETSEKVQNE